jgi:hypothetical protein
MIEAPYTFWNLNIKILFKIECSHDKSFPREYGKSKHLLQTTRSMLILSYLCAILPSCSLPWGFPPVLYKQSKSRSSWAITCITVEQNSNITGTISASIIGDKCRVTIKYRQYICSLATGQSWEERGMSWWVIFISEEPSLCRLTWKHFLITLLYVPVWCLSVGTDEALCSKTNLVWILHLCWSI